MNDVRLGLAITLALPLVLGGCGRGDIFEVPRPGTPAYDRAAHGGRNLGTEGFSMPGAMPRFPDEESRPADPAMGSRRREDAGGNLAGTAPTEPTLPVLRCTTSPSGNAGACTSR